MDVKEAQDKMSLLQFLGYLETEVNKLFHKLGQQKVEEKLKVVEVEGSSICCDTNQDIIIKETKEIKIKVNTHLALRIKHEKLHLALLRTAAA